MLTLTLAAGGRYLAPNMGIKAYQQQQQQVDEYRLHVNFLGRPTQQFYAGYFFYLLAPSFCFVSYPRSSLNGTQPMPHVGQIWKCMSKIRGVPSVKNRGPKVHIFDVSRRLRNWSFTFGRPNGIASGGLSLIGNAWFIATFSILPSSFVI